MNINKNNANKALVVSTVASTIDQFCMNDIDILQQKYEVYVAANFTLGNNTSIERIKDFKVELNSKNVKAYEINFNRNPIRKENWLAYIEIKRLIKKNHFDIIHCHTPVAAMIVRLAARKARKNGTKVIYTAHGFHFFKGAPFINWILYYPIESWLARYTDILITVNKEDYTRAKKSFKARRIEYITGVGVDIDKIRKVKVDKSAKRNELGLPEDAFVLLSVGELNKNKNHEVIIRALSKLNNLNAHYVICGQGPLEYYLKELINHLGLEKQVHLLGYRRDIIEICKASDLFVFPSYREGLSVALMEAMATGLPIVCSNIRGNSDLVNDEKGGYLVNPNDTNGFSKCIERLIKSKALREEFRINNLNEIEGYSIEKVIGRMKSIY